MKLLKSAASSASYDALSARSYRWRRSCAEQPSRVDCSMVAACCSRASMRIADDERDERRDWRPFLSSRIDATERAAWSRMQSSKMDWQSARTLVRSPSVCNARTLRPK